MAPRANGGPHSSPTGLAPGLEARHALHDWRRTISSNPEVTGRFDLSSTRIPRWKSWWEALRAFLVRCWVSGAARGTALWGAVRGFVTHHRILSSVIGAVALGVLSGFGKTFGQYFAGAVLAWLTMRF